MKKVKIITAFLLLSLGALGQQALVTPQFCKFVCFSGEVRLGGLYRQQEIKRTYLSDTARSTLLTGSLLLNANTFFWHPNFMLLDVALEYSPEQSRDYYSVIPDEGETRTLKKLDLRTTLFQRKVVSLYGFYNTSETFSNREYLSDIRTNASNWGGVFYLRSKALPLSISYQQGKIVQKELRTSRLYSYENSTLSGNINKSFGNRDRHELTVSRNEFKRIEREYAAVTNRLDDILLSDEVFFDKRRRHSFHSMIDAADQKGYDTLKRVQAFETVNFKLPAHFELTGNYNYFDIDRNIQDINQQVYRGILRHKLFESLNSSVFYEYTDAKQTGFDQKDIRKGLDLYYEKKIPAGTLSLSYNLLLQNQDKKGDATTLHIYHEPYVLSTGHIVYFKRPYVEITSVVVRDTSGNLVYQLNFDYLLIPHGNFLEIARVPGGQIADGSTVYVDYTASIPGSYQFDLKSQSWSAGLTFFNKLIGVYYRNIEQNYSNLHETDYLTLDIIRQQVYGVRTEYKAFTAGFEYDDNGKSSILPYELKRYYITFQGQLHARLIYSINGNYNDYHLVTEDINQKFADLSGQLAYSLTANSRVNFDLGYRHQKGQGIDLDLLNARLEFTTRFRQTSFTIGLQTFKRNYMEEIDNYNGGYFRISRRF